MLNGLFLDRFFFWIIFTTGKLLVLVLTVFFVKGGNTVYNSYQS